MDMKDERLTLSRELVDFFKLYIEILSEQLGRANVELGQAITTVFEGTSAIAAQVAASSAEAEAILNTTYFAPDQKTSDLVSQVQASADALLDQACPIPDSSPPNRDTEEATNNRLRRSAGLFSKHLESLSTMDVAVGSLLFRIVGALSNDDVLQQKIKHICSSLVALQAGLTYVLIDFRARFTCEEVSVFKEDLLLYTHELYTTERERDLYASIFGPAPLRPKRRRHHFAG